MIYSLRARLLLAVGAVVVTALVVVAISYSETTRTEFHRHMSVEVQIGQKPQLPAMTPLSDQVREALKEVNNQNLASVLREMAGDLGQGELLLVDPNGNALASSFPEDLKPQIRIEPNHRVQIDFIDEEAGSTNRMVMGLADSFAPVRDELGGLVGNLYYLPMPEEEAIDNEEAFLGSVNRRLIVLAGVASILALAFAAVATRKILRPVEELTQAVYHMSQGDLGQRVANVSKDEIGQLANAFNNMADNLQSLERQRRNMVNDAAHELRTPLNNIRGQLEAIQDQLLEPNKAVIDSLHEDAATLTRVVSDLQMLALAEADRLSIEPTRFAIDEEIGSAVAGFRTVLKSRKIQLDLSFPSLAPVFGDPQRTRQVVCNLLENAMKHTPDGGRIEVSAAQAAGFVVVRLGDNGPGIGPEHLDHVFERFYRTDYARTSGTGGSGLGLAIVKQLVEAMDGRVGVRSEPGRGAVFSFTLPIARSESVPAQQQVTEETKPL